MRIVFAVNNYPPRMGGVEVHVHGLARHLVAAGHTVVVHTLTDRGSAPTSGIEDGVEVHRWPEAIQVGGLLGFPTPGSVRGLWRALTRSGADVVATQTRFFPLTWLGVAAARRAGIPVIHTEHGSDHVASPSPLIRWASRAVDLTAGRWSLRHADAVVGVSDEVASFVRRLAGVSSGVFHNAIEPPAPGRDASPRPHLVFVGRIVPGKGWEDFLDAVAASDAGVTAEVLGDGPDLDALRAKVAALGLGDRVAIRGRVPMTQVYDALAGAILVNPTRLSEGFQTTLLEALAVGGRVVTYPVPGAALLAGQGAPVVVVDRTPQALAEGVRTAQGLGAWPDAGVAAWTWPVRAQEYGALADSVRAQSKG